MITVNGREYLDIKDISLKDFLLSKGYNIKLIAVECNKDIVPKSQYENTILKDGDRLEVVSFVGGG